jgi:hypothetical protein
MNSNLAPAILAAIVAISTMIAGGLFSYQLTLLGIAFGLVTIIAICAGLYSQYGHALFNGPPRHRVLIFCTALSAAIIIFAAIETGPLQDLGYLRNVVIITGRINGAHELARYVAVNNRDHTLMPITVLTFAHLFNHTDKYKNIIGYNLEYAKTDSGPWIRLCRVDLEKSNTIYFLIDNVTDAIPIIFDRRFDEILRRGPIAPNGVISGWSAWYCPALAVNCEQEHFMLTTVDATGLPEKHDMQEIKKDVPVDLLPTADVLVRPWQRTDLSIYRPHWPATCEQR